MKKLRHVFGELWFVFCFLVFSIGVLIACLGNFAGAAIVSLATWLAGIRGVTLKEIWEEAKKEVRT